MAKFKFGGIFFKFNIHTDKNSIAQNIFIRKHDQFHHFAEYFCKRTKQLWLEIKKNFPFVFRSGMSNLFRLPKNNIRMTHLKPLSSIEKNAYHFSLVFLHALTLTDNKCMNVCFHRKNVRLNYM